jgi:hypothetical protein
VQSFIIVNIILYDVYDFVQRIIIISSETDFQTQLILQTLVVV